MRSAAHHFLLVVVLTTMQGAAHLKGQSHAVARSSVYGGPLLILVPIFGALTHHFLLVVILNTMQGAAHLRS